MSTFYHTLSLFKHNASNLHMAFCRLIKSRCNNFCLHTTSHICNFFRTFINQKHNHICFRMVGCNGISNIFHQDSLTSLRLCNNERTLAFTDRREEINHTGRKIILSITLAQLELLIREKWSEMFEWYAVAY